MGRAAPALLAAAALAAAAAALHVAYALAGGITGTWTAYPLAAAAVAGAVLLALAWRRGSAWLAIAALPLCWLPPIATWPLPLLSLAGWAVVLLCLGATVAVGAGAWLAQRDAT